MLMVERPEDMVNDLSEDTNLPTEDPEEVTEVTEEDEDVTAEEDPIEEAIRARLEAERERIAQEVSEQQRREHEARLEAERARLEQEARAQAILNSFGATVREVRDNLKQLTFWDSEGNERTLSDEEIQEYIVTPFLRYNQIGEQSARFKVYSDLAKSAITTLPEDAGQEFTKRATGKPLHEWLEEYAELKAASTKWAKAKEKEMEAAIKAAEARGFKKGREAPASPPPTDTGRPVRRGSVDRTSITGITQALSKGLITQEEFQQLWKEIT